MNRALERYRIAFRAYSRLPKAELIAEAKQYAPNPAGVPLEEKITLDEYYGLARFLARRLMKTTTA